MDKIFIREKNTGELLLILDGDKEIITERLQRKRKEKKIDKRDTDGNDEPIGEPSGEQE